MKLLRVLLLHRSTSLSVTDAARLAGLTAAGARRALARLRSAGFVHRVGSGHVSTYGIREDAVGLRALAQAFDEEQQRYDRFIAAIRDAVSLPELIAVWLEPLPTSPSVPVHLFAVSEVRAVSWVHDELRARLVGPEATFDVIIEVTVLTNADLPAPSAGAIAIWGVLPGAPAPERPRARTHAAATDRALRMSREIAGLIRRDPTLVERARRHVLRLVEEEQGMALSDILEWRQLLDSYSPERVADLLASESSRAERLRQSSPFFAVLSASERDAILDRISGHE